MTIAKTILALSTAAFATIAATAQAQVLTADVTGGRVSGVAQDKVSAFLGIPFAADTGGANRWKPPVDPTAWKGVRKADKFGPSCQQVYSPNAGMPYTKEYVVTGNVSEDCLSLNIWTPARRSAERLPVMVWIHGGGFSGGSSAVPIYDGANLAKRGMVVVTINYRLGVFGFMAHPLLAKESAHNASGNYGLLDQIAALKWVQTNVAAFGGDPAKVTIAGQSAGAAAVHDLIATPLAKGLFVRAIAQSGSGLGIGVPSREEAEKAGVELQQAVGASSMADLRRLSAADVESAVAKMNRAPTGFGLRFSPSIDGWVLPDAATARSATNDVPLLTGMTANEGSGFSPMYGKMTVDWQRAEIAKAYGNFAPRFQAVYGAENDARVFDAHDQLSRERGLASMAMWAHARSSKQPLYAYLWTHPEPGLNSERYRAFHSAEIPYVFNTLDKAPERGFTDLDRRMADLMGSYWSNWVKFGNPNGAGLPQWPLYTPDTQILEIGVKTVVRPVLSPDRVKLFEDYVASGGKLSIL